MSKEKYFTKVKVEAYVYQEIEADNKEHALELSINKVENSRSVRTDLFQVINGSEVEDLLPDL
jgi:hypothetical protein